MIKKAVKSLRAMWDDGLYLRTEGRDVNLRFGGQLDLDTNGFLPNGGMEDTFRGTEGRRYPHTHLRMTFNYVLAWVDRDIADVRDAGNDTGVLKLNKGYANIFMIRFQIDF